jgi:hypothetical protein
LTVISTLSPDAKITPEIKKEIEEAKKMPITFDEDSPEMTPAMEEQFRCAVRMRNRLLSSREKKNA